MKPAILLYNPPATLDKTGWLRPIPLNLLSICSLIDEREFEICIAQEFADETYNLFRSYLNDAVCLGISCMTGTQISHGLRLAQMIKETISGLHIIWGGYHPTALPEQSLQCEFVDIVVRGYGEITFRELVERLANKRSYEDVQGISFIKDNKVINTPSRPVPNLNNLPSLPYHLFDVEKFFRECGTKTLHYISSRGCPHRCGFCADCVIYKRRWNALSAERVLSDLERLKKTYNYDSVRFYDSNLFVNEERIKKICEGVVEKNLNFKWLKCNGDAFSLARYSLDTFQLMNKAGVSNVLLGIESGYEPALRCIEKAAKVEDNLETVRRLHEHNISIGFSFMFGFPYDLPKENLEEEHRKELVATMRTIADFSDHYLPGDYYLLFVFTPYPGVRLFPLYKKLGYYPPDSLKAWSKVNLDENSSSRWISPHLLDLHGQCLKIKWFFAHKLERNIFLGSRNLLARKYAKFLDTLAREILRKRVDQGLLTVPVIFSIVWFYFLKVKGYVQTIGWKGFITKAFLKLKYKMRPRKSCL